MGNMADMMTDGTMCMFCGVYLDPEEYGEPDGVPRTCEDCKESDDD